MLLALVFPPSFVSRCFSTYSSFLFFLFLSFFDILSPLYKLYTAFPLIHARESYPAGIYTGVLSPPLSAGDSRRNRRREGESTLAMYRLGIMAVGTFRSPLSTTGRLLLCVTPLKSSTPTPSFLIPFCGFSSSTSSWRRICELNSNGSPPFRSFQRVPMFSLRAAVQPKSSFPFHPPPDICFSLFLFRRGLTQVKRGHYNFISRQLPRIRCSAVLSLLALYGFSAVSIIMDNIS